MKKILLVVFLLFAPSFAFASFDQNLQYGSHGLAVRDLQIFLASQGCLTMHPTGNFFGVTRQSVKCFQGQHNLPTTGYFGPMTRALANSLAASGTSTQSQGTQPQGTQQQQTSPATPPTPGQGQQNQQSSATATSSDSSQYSLAQAMSDNAQLSTIAFSGLAFITGSAGADTFFPPGKVADFFGFQYMRDVDTAGYGHNTQFLTRVANNVLSILTDDQKAKLVALAKVQAPKYTNFAYNRFLVTNAFRRDLTGDIPAGSAGLSTSSVATYVGDLYKTDADLSYNRALVVGAIINSFTDTQKAYLAKMQFNDFTTWPDVSENAAIKQGLSNSEYIALMTYASELFSWYKGSVVADTYFCPERHGTYFGGFYMKDYPAVGNNDYFISTAETGDSGKGFLDALTPDQRAQITSIIDAQRSMLAEVAQIRATVSSELRKAMTGGTPDQALIDAQIERYGELDGAMSALYASRFAAVNKTLTDTQRATLVKLRNLAVVPTGAYLFSTPVAMPTVPNTDFMFGVGSAPMSEGQTTPPATFTTAANTNPPLGQ